MGLLVGAEAVEVGVRKGGAAGGDGWGRVRRSHGRLACHESVDWDLANCLCIGEFANSTN